MASNNQNDEVKTTSAAAAADPETSEIVKGSPEWWAENVPVKLFKDTKDYKDDVFIGINGKTWQIKRGVEVKVPRYVAQVLEDSYKQDLDTASMIEQYGDEFDAKSKKILGDQS